MPVFVLFKDYYPKKDDLLAERIRAAGAIIIGKTNVPEFGAGSNTFNPVFGATLNPYNLKLTCGGSTGGGAVAVVGVEGESRKTRPGWGRLVPDQE